MLSKNLVIIISTVFAVQILQVQTEEEVVQSLIGLAAKPGFPPYELVKLNPRRCEVISKIAKFTDTVIVGATNVGAIDSDGNYYANFKTKPTWYGPGVTYTIDLNNPSAGWSSFGGEINIDAIAVSSEGVVYGVGTNSSQATLGVTISAASKTVTNISDYPANSAPIVGPGATIDGSGNFWSDIYEVQGVNQFFVAMATPSGEIMTQSGVPAGETPNAIHYDSQNNSFFSICSVGFRFQLCTITPQSTNSYSLYGPSLTALSLLDGGVFSSTERILYAQFSLTQEDGIPNYTLFGFNVDNGKVVSRCILAGNAGGVLYDLVLDTL